LAVKAETFITGCKIHKHFTCEQLKNIQWNSFASIGSSEAGNESVKYLHAQHKE
jgi:hypothetical protein